MHVLCPTCETEYEIPSLRRPRTLRCARCACEWRVMPVPALAEADGVGPAMIEPEMPRPEMPRLAMPVPDHAAGDASAEPEAPAAPLAKQRSAGTAAARTVPDRGIVLIGTLWLLSAAAVAAGLWTCWHWRLPIAHHWPPSLRLYRLLPGGTPAPVGLARPGA